MIRHTVLSVILMLSMALPVVAQTVNGPAQSTAITEVMLTMDDPSKWATPKKVVPPEYPAGELAKGATQAVDVTIRVDSAGKVESHAFSNSTPAAAPFEEAVAAVIRLWQFEIATDANCAPRANEGNVRVWFEIKDGNPSVSVSGKASGSGSPPVAVAKSLNRKEAIGKIRYPVDARRGAAEADLYVVLRVNAASGSVETAQVSAIRSAKKLDNKAIELFTDALWPLRELKFEPTAVPNYRVCVPVIFRLS